MWHKTFLALLRIKNKKINIQRLYRDKNDLINNSLQMSILMK